MKNHTQSAKLSSWIPGWDFRRCSGGIGPVPGDSFLPAAPRTRVEAISNIRHVVLSGTVLSILEPQKVDCIAASSVIQRDSPPVDPGRKWLRPLGPLDPLDQSETSFGPSL